MTIRKKTSAKPAVQSPPSRDAAAPAPAAKHPAIDLITPILIGFTAFLLITGGGILNPVSTGWLATGDPAQHYLGWLFFRTAPMLQQPLGLNTNFGMELGGSIVYSDSLPLLAFLFKPFRALLPEDFQYAGLWICLCFVLQSVFAWKLLAKCTVDFRIKALGSVFFLMAPPFLFRLHGHEALMGHWLILAGLVLYWNDEYAPRRWVALLVAATLVHAYLAAMTGVLWMADLTARVVSRRIAAARAAAWMAGTISLCALVAWQAGYFVLGSAVSGGGFGYYRMNLLSMFIGYPDFSALLPGTAGMIALRPESNGDYEGVSFLGVGMIVLAIMALGEFARDPSQARRLRGHWPLLAGAALLTLYAISNHVAAGAVELIAIPLPAIVDHVANIFRCSGRMFWPVFYLIYLATFRLLAAKYRPAVLAGIMAVLIPLQTADAAEAFRALRTKLERLAWTTPLQSPFWAEAGKRYRNVFYVLPHNVPRGYFELCRFAGTNGMGINIGSFARLDAAIELELGKRTLAEVHEGRFQRQALYVFGRGDLWAEALRTKRPSDRAGVVNGVRVLAPGWAECPECMRAAPLADEDNAVLLPYRLGTKVEFGIAANSVEFAMEGWSIPETWGTWNDGVQASLGMRVEDKIEWDLALDMEFHTYTPNQTFDVVVNGTSVAKLVYETRGRKSAHVVIPRAVAESRGGDLRIDFRMPNAVSPLSLGQGNDPRRLAMGMVNFTIVRNLE
ncbi:MAG: DUF6311 domain-containing protein [Bryobacteraceae bacterium]